MWVHERVRAGRRVCIMGMRVHLCVETAMSVMCVWHSVPRHVLVQPRRRTDHVVYHALASARPVNDVTPTCAAAGVIPFGKPKPRNAASSAGKERVVKSVKSCDTVCTVHDCAQCRTAVCSVVHYFTILHKKMLSHP